LDDNGTATEITKNASGSGRDDRRIKGVGREGGVRDEEDKNEGGE